MLDLGTPSCRVTRRRRGAWRSRSTSWPIRIAAVVPPPRSAPSGHHASSTRERRDRRVRPGRAAREVGPTPRPSRSTPSSSKIEHPDEVGLVHDLLDELEPRLACQPAGSASPTSWDRAGRWPGSRHRGSGRRPAVPSCSGWPLRGGRRAPGDRDRPSTGRSRACRDRQRRRRGRRPRDRRDDPGLPGGRPAARRGQPRAVPGPDGPRVRRRSRGELGMAGKWVGPGPLLAVLLAFEAGFEPDRSRPRRPSWPATPVSRTTRRDDRRRDERPGDGSSRAGIDSGRRRPRAGSIPTGRCPSASSAGQLPEARAADGRHGRVRG
jgi:hypothetical protein